MIKYMKKLETTNKNQFYKISLAPEKESGVFYTEYNILSTTVESVNNFGSLCEKKRTGIKGGPYTHGQQDLYRAMLVFACAGLDVFVKQLVKNKLSQLIQADKEVEIKFKEYVKRGIKKDDKEILNTVALALIDNSPRDIFLNEYIQSMTGNSLQSVNELEKISNASGLNTKKIFNNVKRNQIRDAFIARNQIIHEMDINIDNSQSKTSTYRTRRKRVTTQMEKYTKIILRLAEEIFTEYKNKFEKFQIDVEKRPNPVTLEVKSK